MIVVKNDTRLVGAAKNILQAVTRYGNYTSEADSAVSVICLIIFTIFYSLLTRRKNSISASLSPDEFQKVIEELFE